MLQAIPWYVMNIFLLPTSIISIIDMNIFLLPTFIISIIEKMMNSLWRGHGGSNNRSIHWMSWDKFSIHKNHEGMGFKDLTALNLATLGKQGWKFRPSLVL